MGNEKKAPKSQGFFTLTHLLIITAVVATVIVVVLPFVMRTNDSSLALADAPSSNMREECATAMAEWISSDKGTEQVYCFDSNGDLIFKAAPHDGDEEAYGEGTDGITRIFISADGVVDCGVEIRDAEPASAFDDVTARTSGLYQTENNCRCECRMCPKLG